MADPTIKGSIATAIQQGKIHTTFSRTKGASTVIEYHGTQAQVINQALIYQANDGWETEIQNPAAANGGVWVLVATYPEDLLTGNPSLPAPVWTIDPAPYERNVLECTDRVLVANLSTNTKDNIEYRLKHPLSHSSPVLTSDVSQLGNAIAVYNIMRLGVEARLEYNITVKRTLIVSRLQNINWSLANNDKVISRAFLISNYQVDNATANFLLNSTGLLTDFNNVPYMWGYLEEKPTRQTLANNKVQLEQRWHYGKWIAGANGLYDVIV